MYGVDLPQRDYERAFAKADASSRADRSLAAKRARGVALTYRSRIASEGERAKLRLRWRAFFQEWDVVLCPYKVEWERELERRKRLGIVAALPLPHPDDIVIDLNRNLVITRGPRTQEEKVEWDHLYATREQLLDDINELQKTFERTRSPDTRADLELEIAENNKLCEFITNAIKNHTPRAEIE